ncbi:MAG: hypothetical protein QW078_03985 [Thermoplasmatales archaeon]
MKEFHNFSLKEGSSVKVVLRAGNEKITIEGKFMGVSDTIQPLLYVYDGNNNFLINMLDIIYIETKDELEEIENKKKADYLF